MSLGEWVASFLQIDLIQGLSVTGTNFFRRKATIQYPEKKAQPTDRFRGMFGFSEERCIVCHACAKACPISIIHIRDHFEEFEVDGKKRKKKVLDRYDIDVKRCMFCGLCEEACPTKPTAIWLTTRTYETATRERHEQLYFTKERLQSWEGVTAFNGVVPPDRGMLPDDPSGAKAASAPAAAAGGEE